MLSAVDVPLLKSIISALPSPHMKIVPSDNKVAECDARGSLIATEGLVWPVSRFNISVKVVLWPLEVIPPHTRISLFDMAVAV